MSNYVKIILDVNKSFQEAILITFKILFSANKSNQHYNVKSNNDEAALRSDWERIGDDLRRSILAYDRRITK